MGRSIKRMSHLRNIRKKRYGTKTAIKKYLETVWIPKSEKELGIKLKIRTDSKYFAILIVGGKHKNILAFIDKETGAILRPKNSKKPHTKYQPKDIKSNINDTSGGMRYVKNLKFRYLP